MLFVVICALIVVVAICKFTAKRSVKGVPTVKGGLPFFGHVFTMLKGSPWDSMAQWVLEYGTIYKVHLFGSEAIFVADPALLKVVLQTKLNTFKKDLVWTYKPFLVLLGNGLVTSDGKSWLRQRALLANHLKKDILEDIPPLAIRAVGRLMEKLDLIRDKGEVIEMAEEFRHLTLQVIAEAVLSISAEESDETFAKMYLPIVQEGNLRTWAPHRMYLPTPSWFKFRSDVATLNNYVTKIIVDRWNLRKKEGIFPNPPKDVLDKILASYCDDEWDEKSIHQIRDEIKTFILAGHETSASMLAWALYELTLPINKTRLDKLLEEVDDVFQGCRDPVSNRIIRLPGKSQLDKLVFSECCLRESLRKYSVVPTVVRLASEDVEMNQYFIPKGSTIMVCIQGVHHNPEYWPEPLVYKPERFLEPIAPYTFLPFVEGPRMCLGQYLSLLETKIVLAMVLATYKFELTNPDDAGKKHAFMVPIIPATGHFMKISNR
jgi:cytochrome P450